MTQSAGTDVSWDEGLAQARAFTRDASDVPPSGDVWDLYRPLLAPGPFVVGHLAQTLDGFVALTSGESQWISGFEDRLHTHRLRALVDAVVVGVQTVVDDDPQLTVRHCAGESPVRVVIDPDCRAPLSAKLFNDGGPTLRVCREAQREFDIEVPCADGVLPPPAIVAALAARGLDRVLVEGGGRTVSHFLRADAMDRLHLVVAPMLIGGGQPAFPHPLCGRLADALRFAVRPVSVGVDWLFDCDVRKH